MGGDEGPLPDPIAEGIRIAETAAARGVTLRVLGGVAIAIRCPSSRRPPLTREYADIDLATTASAKEGVVGLLQSLGYDADREFNTLHGRRRLFFWDEAHRRQVDVFVEEARLCHRIDLGPRIELVPLTLSLADLTVLKLQVVETNVKDHLDICAIFADHDLSDDESGVNSAHISALTAADWGLWRTLSLVAERSERFALELPGFPAGPLVAERLRRLRRQMEAAPKTRSWRLRSRLGERKRWYELPEEVH